MAEPRAPAPELPFGFVLVGIIAGTHGLNGRVRVVPESDNPDRYCPGVELHVDGAPYVIESATKADGRYLVKLRDVDDDAAAEGLVGHQALARESSVPPAPEHTYYHYQLIDLAVRTADGDKLGVLTEVLGTGANDVYVISGEDVELLLPALGSVVLAVDLERGEMVVDVPEGIEPRSLRTAPKRKPPRRASRRKRAVP